jgi:glycosyltransferase involved in cell wall biosynthesis
MLWYHHVYTAMQGGRLNMNLLIIPKVFPRASVIGGPILIHHRIKNLSQMGHDITLLSPAYTQEDYEDTSLKPYCKEILLFDIPGKRSDEEVEQLRLRLGRPPFFLSGDGGYDPNIDNVFRSLLKTHHFDAIIAEYSMMGQYLEGAKDIIPPDTLTVISVHECYTQAFRMRIKKGEPIPRETIEDLYKYEFAMYRSVDRVLTLTRQDMETVIGLSPDLKGKVDIVPHGVDTDFYTPSPEKKTHNKNILFLGNFLHGPNVNAVHNFMTNCWETISNEVPDAIFQAIGFSPPEELTAYRSNNVIVREGGAHQDVRSVYWNSDVFVAPIELGGGFRGKMLEALACGLPIVSTKLAAFGIDPINGQEMFITDDYTEFTRHVINLLQDSKLKAEVSTKARALAERFDHRNAAAKLNQLFVKHKK